MTIKTILLNDIRIDGNTQSRVEINQDAVTHYADLMRDDTVMPPIIVFFDGVDHWMADGFHRFHATSSLDKKANIVADVRKGTQRDAILFSLNANVPHGLSLTWADKRKAVTTMLSDPEWSELSDRAIARHCGCSHTFVLNTRKELSEPLATKSKRGNVATESASTTPADTAASGNVASQTPSESGNVATSGPSEAEKNAEAAHGDDDPAKLLEESYKENAELRALLAVAEADDKAAEVIKYKRIADVARIRQNELMETVNARENDLKKQANWLRRIGVAMGEEDYSKLAAQVEAMARTVKASSK